MIADCWIPGEPKEAGYYLTRWQAEGHQPWIYLFEIRFFDEIQSLKGLTMYMDATGGNAKFDRQLSRFGKPTHYCLPTAENFGKVYAAHLVEHEEHRERVRLFMEELDAKRAKESK